MSRDRFCIVSQNRCDGFNSFHCNPECLSPPIRLQHVQLYSHHFDRPNGRGSLVKEGGLSTSRARRSLSMPSNQTLMMIVGNKGGTNVADSLCRSASSSEWSVVFCDASQAYDRNVWLQRLAWHFGGHRPVHLLRFSASLEAVAERARPSVLISTGLSPVTSATLSKLKAQGLKCLHYSTDDPWNPTQFAQWFLRSLPIYDHIFTTRRSNLKDFYKIGCTNVSYLPFAFDLDLFFPPKIALTQAEQFDILFVGGADSDRAITLSQIANSGLRLALYGDHWGKYKQLRNYFFGRADVSMLRELTTRAPINLCLCRKANRDGHVMRSFEIPAIGGFMVAEDTEEHRELFGPEGEGVLYFVSAREAIEKANWALRNPDERKRMSAAAHQRILKGQNTYFDRLEEMLSR